MSPMERDLSALIEKVAALETENKLLREKIDLLLRKSFGRSSEKLDGNQLTLLEEEAKKDEAPAALEPAPGAERKKPSSRKPRQPRSLDHLPVEEQVLLPDEVKDDPSA